MHFSVWRSDSYTENPSFSVKNPSFEYKIAKQGNDLIISVYNPSVYNPSPTWRFSVLSEVSINNGCIERQKNGHGRS